MTVYSIAQDTTNPCAFTLCAEGTRCEVINGGAQCRNLTCADTECAGQCEDTVNGPKCTTDPCATMKCANGPCIVVEGKGQCSTNP